MVDYRPIPDERDVFHEYQSYAFVPEQGVPAYDPDEHDTPRMNLGAHRGLYPDPSEDADPRCICRHYWLESHVRGDRHPTAGLASVATPPEYRRHGYVRQLLERSLAEYRERGCRFSVLWPFDYRFYRQYGWETSNRIVSHECDPETLSFATAAVGETGSFRRLEADDHPALEPPYEAYTDRYALALERDEDWWRHRVLADHEIDPFVYAYERDGEVAGYLVYRFDDDGGERTMRVSELVAADHDAFLALLSFCHNHDSQVHRVRLRLPEAAPLREVATRPDRIETTVNTGPMVRVVDVAETLAALSYPDVEASLTMAVEDPLADWNDGTFALEVSDRRASCERAADGRGTAPGAERETVTGDDPIAGAGVDVHADVGALSQLVVGARSAAGLERTGRLETAGEDVLETLGALFPETDVYLGDRF